MPDKRCHKDLRDWYAGPLGRLVLEAENKELERVIANLFGYHILQLGSLGEHCLLDASRILHRVVVDCDDGHAGLHALPEALPILTDSIDVIVLPHTLEFGTDPHEVLREADRSLIPEGHIIILGFNPWSLWGLRRLLAPRDARAPWCGRFLGLSQIKDWLRLLGFDTVYVRMFFHCPPLSRRSVLQRLRVLALRDGRNPLMPAGLYLLLAKKRVVTLTPIRPRWRPQRRLIGAGITESTVGRH